MPNFDLRGIKIAKYVNTSGTITYTGPQSIGDAMECNLELKFAEGRLYAESALAEYMKLATGGTISIGAKYIPAAAQTAMYGCAASTRTANTKTITGLKYTAKDAADYVESRSTLPMLSMALRSIHVSISERLCFPRLQCSSQPRETASSLALPQLRASSLRTTARQKSSSKQVLQTPKPTLSHG